MTMANHSGSKPSSMAIGVKIGTVISRMAAALLGIHRALLYKKLKKYGLPLSDRDPV